MKTITVSTYKQLGMIMKTIPMILLSTLGWYASMPAMLKHVIPEITYSAKLPAEEHVNTEWCLKQYGEEDASPLMQERLKVVMAEYKERSLQIPETLIIKQMKPSAIEQLKNRGSSTPNVINNGVNMVHTTCDHEELTANESKQLLAHELAHIALGRNTWLNPHWYMNLYTNKSKILSLLGPGLVVYTLKKGKTPSSVGIAVTVITAYILSAITCNKPRQDTLRTLPGGALGEVENYYSCLSKLEEIECDMIAAYVMPEGGKHGAELWQRKLVMKGNHNGTEGSHPYYSTRVKYHKAMQWIQEKTA